MNVNPQALRAAALFTSSEKDRHVLQAVKVSDGGTLLLATDSYVMCAVGLPEEAPRDLVARVRANEDAESLLVLASDVAKATKIAPKPQTHWEITAEKITLPGVGSVELEPVLHEFPRVSSILPSAKPEAISEIAFDPARLGVFHKASQLLYGANTPKRGEVLPRLVLHGGEGSLKPALFSISRGPVGTLVALLMTCKEVTGWEGK